MLIYGLEAARAEMQNAQSSQVNKHKNTNKPDQIKEIFPESDNNLAIAGADVK